MLLHFLSLATFAVCATAFLEAPRGVLPPTVMLPREPEKCCLAIEFHIRRHENNMMRDKRGDDLISEHSHIAADKKELKIAEVWNATRIRFSRILFWYYTTKYVLSNTFKSSI